MFSLIYITSPTQNEAESIANILLEEQLVACVNILPRVESMYCWEGKIEKNAEIILLLKTQTQLVETVFEKVKTHHSYDCPCMIELPITSGYTPFLQWIQQQTSLKNT